MRLATNCQILIVEVPRNAPGDQAWTLGAKHAGSNLIEVDLSDNAIEVLGAQETHRDG